MSVPLGLGEGESLSVDSKVMQVQTPDLVLDLVMWLQTECLRWTKGSLRRRGGYRKGIDGDAKSSEMPPMQKGCLCCWRELAIRFK